MDWSSPAQCRPALSYINMFHKSFESIDRHGRSTEALPSPILCKGSTTTLSRSSRRLSNYIAIPSNNRSAIGMSQIYDGHPQNPEWMHTMTAALGHIVPMLRKKFAHFSNPAWDLSRRPCS